MCYQLKFIDNYIQHVHIRNHQNLCKLRREKSQFMPCLRPLEIKLSRKWEPVANKNHGNCRVLYFKITSSLKNYYYDKQHVDTLQKKPFLARTIQF